MAITLSTGTTLSIAKAYDTAVTFTNANISNAAEAVITVTHALAAGDYIEVKSGWGLLDQRVLRVKSVTGTTSFVLEGFSTLDLTKFPTGSGGGSFRKITSWTQITQAKSLSTSGGEQQFSDITSLVDTVAKQVPTIRSAVTMTVDVFDDPSLGWYADVSAADAARLPYALKMDFPNGSKLVANAYWGLMKVPTITQNEALMTQISLSYAAEPMRYAS
jgi:hypothetical protein